MSKKFWVRQNTVLFIFCAPFLSIFLIFFIFPFFNGVVMSFTNSNGFTNIYEFVGLQNYIELFADDSRFHGSFGITILFTVLNVTAGNVLALLLTFAIESGVRCKNFFRTMFFLPYIFALVIIGFTWKFIYTQWIPQFGRSVGLDFLVHDYLGNPSIAIFSVIIMQIWYQLGYYLVIYIAGMQSIDRSLLEAAAIDGASNFKKYTKIVIPLLYPSISICLFTGIASSLKVFDAILSLTGGGPGYATEVISLNIYFEAMGDAQRYGYGMAKSLVLAVLIFAITFVQRRFFEKREVEA